MSRTSSIGALPCWSTGMRKPAWRRSTYAPRERPSPARALAAGALPRGDGRPLLAETYCPSHYELTFSLWLECAECAFLTGELDRAEKLHAELLQGGGAKVDLADVYALKVLLHIVKSQNLQAIDSALACLKLFGIDIPAHPSW